MSKAIDEYFKYYDEYTSKYNSDVAVLMQMGAFYEILGLPEKGNIHAIANVINVNVTKSNKNIQEVSRDNPYLAGFPLASLNKYTLSLIDHGYTVVVVDQHTLKGSKKLTRKVAGVYSSSALPLDTLESRDCVLMSVCKESSSCVSVACVNLSTGAFTVYQMASDALETIHSLVEVHDVKEIVWNVLDGTECNPIDIRDAFDVPVHFIAPNPRAHLVHYQIDFFKKVYSHISFGLLSAAEYFDMERYPLCITNCVLALQFVQSHNERYLKHLQTPRMVHNVDYLVLQMNTLHQLAIFGSKKKTDSVMGIVDHTCTSIGKRHLKDQLSKPFRTPQQITDRLELCELLDNVMEEVDVLNIRRKLKSIVDFVKLQRKMVLGVLSVRELINLYQTYVKVIEINSDVSMYPIQSGKLTFDPQGITECLQTIASTLKLDHQDEMQMPYTCPFVQGVYPHIDNIVNSIAEQYKIIKQSKNMFESKIGIENSVKIAYTESEGYHIVCSKIRTELLKRALGESAKTLVIKVNSNVCKITTSEIQTANSYIQQRAVTLEDQVRAEFEEFIANLYSKYTRYFDELKTFVETLDVIVSNIRCKRDYNYVCPKIHTSESSFLRAKGLRHPIIERVSPTLYVPADITLDAAVPGMVLYAMNATGKSSLLRSVGIGVILAQCGMYVPASEFEICPFNAIATQVEFHDNLWKGQSSFVTEMAGLRQILNTADQNTLVLSDELTKGTEVVSATSIFASTVLCLSKRGTKFLFTTHLTKVAKLPEIRDSTSISICHLSVKIQDNHIVFERKLLPGPCDELYGLEVARATGIDPDVLALAFKIRGSLTSRVTQSDPTGTSDHQGVVKRSRYNAKKVLDACEVCGHIPRGRDTALDTHHINFQNTADSRGFIGHFHKNALGNLVTMCKRCHQDLHLDRIQIHGYIQTSEGVKLQYTRDTSNTHACN